MKRLEVVGGGDSGAEGPGFLGAEAAVLEAVLAAWFWEDPGTRAALSRLAGRLARFDRLVVEGCMPGSKSPGVSSSKSLSSMSTSCCCCCCCCCLDPEELDPAEVEPALRLRREEAVAEIPGSGWEDLR